MQQLLLHELADVAWPQCLPLFIFVCVTLFVISFVVPFALFFFALLRPLAFVMLLLPSSGFHPPLLFVLLLALLPSFVCSFVPSSSLVFPCLACHTILMPFSAITSVNSRDAQVGALYYSCLKMDEHSRHLFRLSPDMIQHLRCIVMLRCHLLHRSFLCTLNFRVAFQH